MFLDFSVLDKDKMKIGLDVHGVLDEEPEFFALMGKYFVENGHEVHEIANSQTFGLQTVPLI